MLYLRFTYIRHLYVAIVLLHRRRRLIFIVCSSSSLSWFSFVYFLNASSSFRWQLVDYISRFCAGHLLYNYVYFEPHCFISIFYSLLHFSSLYFLYIICIIFRLLLVVFSFYFVFHFVGFWFWRVGIQNTRPNCVNFVFFVFFFCSFFIFNYKYFGLRVVFALLLCFNLGCRSWFD